MRDTFHIHGWPRAIAASLALACGALLMALAATHAEAHAGVVPEGSCTPPYQASSPWNTPIGVAPVYESNTAARVNAIGGNLSSDPTQFTYPVYYATASTQTREVQLSGWFSRANADGTTFTNHENATVQVPVPPGAAPASGGDAQVIIIDRSTGKEWGFFNFSAGPGNTFTAANGYGYTVNGSATPVHAHGNGFVARGAGVPYLAGLVRKCEIQAGSIGHALAFAYDAPGPDFVFPATKSDGPGTGPLTLPEGARLQLDPALTTAQINNAWGCSGACLTIAPGAANVRDVRRRQRRTPENHDGVRRNSQLERAGHGSDRLAYSAFCVQGARSRIRCGGSPSYRCHSSWGASRAASTPDRSEEEGQEGQVLRQGNETSFHRRLSGAWSSPARPSTV